MSNFYLKLVRRTTTCLLAVLLLIFTCLPAQANDITNLRNQRYCEILLALKKNVRPVINVYNTIGLNDCPADKWNQLNSPKIKQDTQAIFIHMNGPRYWVIDGMQNSTFIDPNPIWIGGLGLRLAGKLQMRWVDLIKASKPYSQHYVDRNTTWVYNAGKPIYELIDPAKRIYIMQSYSVQNVAQTPASLTQLGKTLKLPTGWSFRTRILKKDAYLTPVNRKATVVQDDLQNTYQLETPGFSAN